MSTRALAVQESALARVAPEDFSEWMRLAPAARAEIELALEAFREIEAAPHGQTMKVCARLARQIKAEHPDLRGFSKQALYAKYRIWSHGGHKNDAQGNPTGPSFAPRDWRFLVKNYHCGNSGLPQEFVTYLVAEFARTTRENDAWRSVYHQLKRDWLAGKDIPGYGSADEWYATRGLVRPRGRFIRAKDLPRGWSECNLWRAVKTALPRKSQRRAAQGQINRVANDWAAQLLRDRSRLRPLQLWTIDDVRLDLQARMYLEGKWQIVYIDALFALDVATGYILGYGIKGRATRGANTEAGRDAGTQMSIDSRDVRHLLLSVLGRFGLPPWMSRLLCENATAKLSGDDEAAFLSLLKDRFEIDYTGMGRGQLLQSGFHEEWGRPGLKGWIESYFRKLHTSLNGMPGTTGRRYDTSRGDLPQRVKYTAQLIRRAEKLIDGPLTPDHPLATQLNFPIASVEEVNGIVGELVDALNWRIEHNLQGFQRLWEHQDSAGNWLPEDALNQLPAAERAGLELVPRMEAPAERAQRLLKPHVAEFRKLDPAVLAALYLEKRKATVRGGRITVRDQRLSTDAMIFAAEGLDAYDAKKDAVLAYLPEDCSHAVIADAATGAHLATMRREGRVDATDQAALGKRAGEVRREHEAELAHVRTYLDSHEQAFAAMRADNEQALSQSHISSPMADAIVEASEQRAAARQRERSIRQQTRSLDEIMAAATDDEDGGEEGLSWDDLMPKL